jgi:hypothetical protein
MLRAGYYALSRFDRPSPQHKPRVLRRWPEPPHSRVGRRSPSTFPRCGKGSAVGMPAMHGWDGRRHGPDLVSAARYRQRRFAGVAAVARSALLQRRGAHSRVLLASGVGSAFCSRDAEAPAGASWAGARRLFSVGCGAQAASRTGTASAVGICWPWVLAVRAAITAAAARKRLQARSACPNPELSATGGVACAASR